MQHDIYRGLDGKLTWVAEGCTMVLGSQAVGLGEKLMSMCEDISGDRRGGGRKRGAGSGGEEIRGLAGGKRWRVDEHYIHD